MANCARDKNKTRIVHEARERRVRVLHVLSGSSGLAIYLQVRNWPSHPAKVWQCRTLRVENV